MKNLLRIVLSAALVAVYSSFVCAAQETSAPSNHRDRYVIVVSMDGFRYDYTDMTRTPNLDKMARRGVSTEMLPSFPASTFPNHYTLATGLVPDHHGLVNNSFWEPEHGERYSIGSPLKNRSYFYLGDPVWNTVQRQGLIAGVTYWVGSDFVIGGGQPRYFLHYADNELISFEKRVDRTLEMLRYPEEERPRLLMIYFSEPDHTGHLTGPGSKETLRQVRRMDKIIGRLRRGIAKSPLRDKIDLIVLSDHGMASISPEKCVSSDKYIKREWTERVIYGTPTSVYSKDAACRDSILAAFKDVEHVHAYKKEEVPAELCYGTSDRLGDIIIIPDLGWRLTDRAGKNKGGHGYSPYDREMHTVFRAEGVDFKKGFKAQPFRNVCIYPLVCYLLGVEPSPNDGNLDEVGSMLSLPED